MKKLSLALLGAGSWGTAVAIHLARAGHQVHLWGRDPVHVQAMREKNCNERYLPGIPFPKHLIATNDLAICETASHIIISVPSHAFISILQQIKKPKQGLIWLTKGLDPATHNFLSTLVAERFGASYPIAIISGPSFANEVAHELPTALILAGNNAAFLHQVHDFIHHEQVRAYFSEDIIGVQCCGAVKNVLAIACGISDGLNFGSNAKAALITRGLAEMSRLGQKLGARQETFMGLAGLGDLVLTCTDNQSRNRRFGLLLGEGKTPAEAEKQIGQAIEGKYNATQVCTLAYQHQVEMPICHAVDALLRGEINPQQAVHTLMSRPPREEW